MREVNMETLEQHMELSEYFSAKNLNQKKIDSYQDGEHKTIQNFYDCFIDPRLPGVDCLVKWYKLLKEYIDSESCILAIRAFGSWGKLDDMNSGKNKKELLDQTLRRGFLTQLTPLNISYIFADNDLAVYFLHMAYNGYIPKLPDLKNAFNNHLFPHHFNRWGKIEKKHAAFKLNGKNPHVGNAGYKVAHVLDCGKNYFLNGTLFNRLPTDLLKHHDCLSRGNYDDWNEANNYCRNFTDKQISNPEIIKGILKSVFLRFVCPMNHFLSPRRKNHSVALHNQTGHKNISDIAEADSLQEYVRGRFYERFKNAGEEKIYEEYLDQLMLPAEMRKIPDDERMKILGDTIINIKINRCSQSKESKLRVKCRNKQENNSKPSSKDTQDSTPVPIGKFAREELGQILRKNKVSQSEIEKMLDPDYSKQKFHLNFPLLITQRTSEKTSCRYYKEPIVIYEKTYYLCSQWYERHRNFLMEWLEKHKKCIG